jgi:hypothetical protein
MWLLTNVLSQLDQLIGGITHSRDYHHYLVAIIHCACYPPGNILDPGGIG